MTGGKLSRVVRLTSGLVALLLLFSSARGQDLMTRKSFEGVLTVQTQNVERIQFFTYSVKLERIRVEPSEREDNDPVVLIDYMSRKTDIILPGREEYVELQQSPGKPKPQEDKGESEVQKTGDTDELQGFSCDKLLVKSEGSEFEVWATKELGTAGTFLTTFSPEMFEPTPWQAEILSMGYFPMRVIERDSTGDEHSRVEITAVQKKNMNELLFRVPAGYEKVEPDALQPKQPSKKRKSR